MQSDTSFRLPLCSCYFLQSMETSIDSNFCDLEKKSAEQNTDAQNLMQIIIAFVCIYGEFSTSYPCLVSTELSLSVRNKKSDLQTYVTKPTEQIIDAISLILAAQNLVPVAYRSDPEQWWFRVEKSP